MSSTVSMPLAARWHVSNVVKEAMHRREHHKVALENVVEADSKAAVAAEEDDSKRG